MAPTVSVIICAYTELRWTQLCDCVESVRRQTLSAHEIILVIDHNERLLARARAQFGDARVIPNQQRQGLSGSRNTGIAAASGELVAFLDDDGVIIPRWLELLCACLEDPSVLGAGGAITPLWEGQQPGWFPEEFFWTVGCTYKGQPGERQAVRNLWGAICLRRAIFETVGGYSVGVGRVGVKPLGDEDTEFCIRAGMRWPQARWMYEPAAVMAHWVPENRARWKYFCSRCYHEGISKSVISRLVGRDRGLAEERHYTLFLLPRAVARGLIGPLRGDFSGPLRAGAIVIGLWLTVLGYVVGSFTASPVAPATAPGDNQIPSAPLAARHAQPDAFE